MKWISNFVSLLILSFPSEGAPQIEEKPLTALDVKLAQTASAPAISVVGRDNQSCLLTERHVPAGKGEDDCTWREQRLCRLTPTLRKVAIFPPGCSEPGAQGLRLRNCEESIRRQPVTQGLMVCNSQSREKCPEPCLECPAQEVGDIATHCRPIKQYWCETSHAVKTSLSNKKLCDDRAGSVSPDCEEVTVREERQRVERVRDCHEKVVGQQCAPINCRFVDLEQDCLETNKTVEIQLTDRVCTVCEPIVGEQVTMREECEEGTTRSCHDDPLGQLWKKFCAVVPSDTEEEHIENEISIENLLADSLNPVNELFDDTLNKLRSQEIEKNNNSNREPKTNIDSSIKFKFSVEIPETSTSTSGEKVDDYSNATTEHVLTTIQTSRRPIPASESSIYIPRRRKPQSSVYFDQNFQFSPVLNSRVPESKSAKNQTIFKEQEPEANDTKLKLENIPQNIDSEVNISGYQGPPYPTVVTTEPVIPTVSIDYETPTSARFSSNEISARFSSNEISSTELTTLTSISQTLSSTSQTSAELSNAALLRRCLLFRTGCDFSLNDIGGPRLTPQTTTSTTVATTTERKLDTNKIKSRLACLFAGNCEPQDQIYPKERPKPIISTSTVPTTTSRVIKEADYSESVSRLACLFHQNCEVNQVLSTTPRAPKSFTPTIETVFRNRSREDEERIRKRAEACFTYGDC